MVYEQFSKLSDEVSDERRLYLCSLTYTHSIVKNPPDLFPTQQTVLSCAQGHSTKRDIWHSSLPKIKIRKICLDRSLLLSFSITSFTEITLFYVDTIYIVTPHCDIHTQPLHILYYLWEILSIYVCSLSFKTIQVSPAIVSLFLYSLVASKSIVKSPSSPQNLGLSTLMADLVLWKPHFRNMLRYSWKNNSLTDSQIPSRQHA